MTDQSQTESLTYLETLVGEGKKYRDIEDLAKAYTHASAHITELKQKEVQTMTELTQAKTLVELLSQVKNEPAPAPTTPNQPEPPANPPSEPVKLDGPTVEDQIASFLAKKEAEQNQQSVFNSISAQFNGDNEKAQEFIKARLASLGLPDTWLVEVAGRSPAAAFELLGVKPAPKATPRVESDINTNALKPTTEGVRDMAFYHKLRRENPRHYWSPQVQSQKESDLKALGPNKFFGKE